MVNFSINNPSYLKTGNNNDIKHYIGKEHDLSIESNTVISKNLNVIGNIIVSGNTLISNHIIPTNLNVDLGKPDKPIRHNFLSSFFWYIKNFKIGVDKDENFNIKKIDTKIISEPLLNPTQLVKKVSVLDKVQLHYTLDGATLAGNPSLAATVVNGHTEISLMNLGDWTPIATLFNFQLIIYYIQKMILLMITCY